MSLPWLVMMEWVYPGWRQSGSTPAGDKGVALPWLAKEWVYPGWRRSGSTLAADGVALPWLATEYVYPGW